MLRFFFSDFMAKKPFVYCPYCKEPIERVVIEGRKRQQCSKCKEIFYVNPLPAVSAIVANEEGRILLTLRDREPCENMWCLPMGFAEADENIQEAVLRELEEETSIKGEIARLIDVQTSDNFYHGNVVIISYEIEKTGGKAKAGDDAKEVQFFSPDSLPELAFTVNKQALDKYLQLKNKSK